MTDAEKNRESELETELRSKTFEYRSQFNTWKENIELGKHPMKRDLILQNKNLSSKNEDLAISSREDFSAEMSTLDRIESEWFETQIDIVQVLKYPLFADMSDPLVQSFHTKLDIAKSLSKKTLGNDFITAVSKVKMAWTALCHEAERIELSKFDKGERKKILMATNLMNIALNEASTPFERQSAYKKAMEQLKGLVVIPNGATQAIDQLIGKMELSA